MEPAPGSAAAASVAGQRLGELDDAEHVFGEQGSAQRVGSKLSSDNTFASSTDFWRFHKLVITQGRDERAHHG